MAELLGSRQVAVAQVVINSYFGDLSGRLFMARTFPSFVIIAADVPEPFPFSTFDAQGIVGLREMQRSLGPNEVVRGPITTNATPKPDAPRGVYYFYAFVDTYDAPIDPCGDMPKAWQSTADRYKQLADDLMRLGSIEAIAKERAGAADLPAGTPTDLEAIRADVEVMNRDGWMPREYQPVTVQTDEDAGGVFVEPSISATYFDCVNLRIGGAWAVSDFFSGRLYLCYVSGRDDLGDGLISYTFSTLMTLLNNTYPPNILAVVRDTPELGNAAETVGPTAALEYILGRFKKYLPQLTWDPVPELKLNDGDPPVVLEIPAIHMIQPPEGQRKSMRDWLEEIFGIFDGYTYRMDGWNLQIIAPDFADLTAVGTLTDEHIISISSSESDASIINQQTYTHRPWAYVGDFKREFDPLDGTEIVTLPYVLQPAYFQQGRFSYLVAPPVDRRKVGFYQIAPFDYTKIFNRQKLRVTVKAYVFRFRANSPGQPPFQEDVSRHLIDQTQRVDIGLAGQPFDFDFIYVDGSTSFVWTFRVNLLPRGVKVTPINPAGNVTYTSSNNEFVAEFHLDGQSQGWEQGDVSYSGTYGVTALPEEIPGEDPPLSFDSPEVEASFNLFGVRQGQQRDIGFWSLIPGSATLTPEDDLSEDKEATYVTELLTRIAKGVVTNHLNPTRDYQVELSAPFVIGPAQFARQLVLPDTNSGTISRVGYSEAHAPGSLSLSSSLLVTVENPLPLPDRPAPPPLPPESAPDPLTGESPAPDGSNQPIDDGTDPGNPGDDGSSPGDSPNDPGSGYTPPVEGGEAIPPTVDGPFNPNYETTFSTTEYPDVNALLADWTVVRGSGSLLALIEENGVRMLRGSYASGTPSTARPVELSWNKVGSKRNVRARIRMRGPNLTNDGPYGPALRMGMTTEATPRQAVVPAQAYAPNTTLTSLRLIPLYNEFTSIPASHSPFASQSYPTPTWVWVELLIIENAYWFKAWIDGNPEPASWLNTVPTNLTPAYLPASGNVGLVFNSTTSHYISYLGVQTEDVRAGTPLPPPGGVTPVPGETVVIDVSNIPTPASAPADLQKFRADPAYVPTASMAWWLDRVFASINRSKRNPEVETNLAKRDMYKYRTPKNEAHYLVSYLPGCKDLRITDQLCKLLNLMLDNLYSAWSLTPSGGKSPKYQEFENSPNWVNGGGYYHLQYLNPTENTDFYGTDTIPLEETLAHDPISLITAVMGINADLKTEYMAAFKRGAAYMLEHFEPKWEKRIGRDEWSVLKFKKAISHSVAGELMVENGLVIIKGLLGIDATKNIAARDRLAFRLVSDRQTFGAPNGQDVTVWRHQNAAYNAEAGGGDGDSPHKLVYLTEIFGSLNVAHEMGIAGFESMGSYANDISQLLYPLTNTLRVKGDVGGSGFFSDGSPTPDQMANNTYPDQTLPINSQRFPGGNVAWADPTPDKQNLKVLVREMTRESYSLSQLEQYPSQTQWRPIFAFALAASKGLDVRTL